MSDPFSLAPQPETYWHLWTGDDGISRQQECTISDFQLGQLGPGDSPSSPGRCLIRAMPL